MAKLHLVAIGFGNLDELCPRARQVLAEADVIAAEDTRHFGSFRQHAQLDIAGKVISFNKDSEHGKTPGLIESLQAGQSVAVVSDAGVPVIADPGFPLVRAAIEAGLTIEPVGFGSPILAALAASGLPPHPFTFHGFLPRKSGQRQTMFTKLSDDKATHIFFESPHRIEKALNDAAAIWPDRKACLARELSKPYEEFRYGTVAELAEGAASQTPKGAIILVISGK